VADAAIKHMHCMEVWGGNRVVDSGVIMAGLDAWVYSQPAGGDTSGGDVHYVSSCASGMISRLMVADVAGHGRPVAELARQLRKLMRRYVNHHTQRGFIRRLNRDFTAATGEGRFATAVIATFEATKNELLISNAGHPPPLRWRRAARDWEYLTAPSASPGVATNVPLGLESETDYEEFRVKLRVGDLVLFYTDSLPEAPDGAGGRLGTDGLLKLVRTLDVVDPARLVPQLLKALAALSGGKAPEDDVTALLFRPNGLRPAIPLRDYLLAPFRFMFAVLGLHLPLPTRTPGVQAVTSPAEFEAGALNQGTRSS